MTDVYQSTKKRNEKIMRLAKERRKNLLDLVPNPFTRSDALNSWGIEKNNVSAQIQKMLWRKEIIQDKEYGRFRIYTKVKEI